MITAPPTDWSVKNGTFIGYVLVAKPPEPSAHGMPKKPEDGWLPFAHDLRSIDSIKQESFENPGLTALYHGNTYVGTINAEWTSVLKAWLRVRHAFDVRPITKEGSNTYDINREAI